jgi:calcineurin-like phosphoesterase family protein
VSNNIWFTSDQHYGHANIIKFCNRPFADVEEMREKLIENHNKLVKPGDRVYNLGDMFWRTVSIGEALAIRHRLNGQHYYIYGNHEELFERNKILQEQFIWCKDAFNLKVDGYPNIWLAHFAHEDWNGSHRGAYHLFGHVHGAKPNPVGLKMDVGVDIRNYAPVSFEEVTSLLGAKAKGLVYKYWSCSNADCKHKFAAVDEDPKICAKCTSPMKLMKSVK